MRHLFLRLFFSIAAIILVLICVQIVLFAVGNYQIVSRNWKNEVFDEFATSIGRTIQQIRTSNQTDFIDVVISNSSERVSGLVFRNGEGSYVASVESIQDPSVEHIRPDEELDRKRIHSPRYEIAIEATENIVSSIGFKPLMPAPPLIAYLPKGISNHDIAGTIAVSINGEMIGYIDVLCYRLGNYAPTAFAFKEIMILFGITFPFACLVSLVIAALLSDRTAKRTKTVQKALSQISNGSYDLDLPKQKVIEYAQMYKSIEILAKDLERHGRSRKEWIRNISHDLNTPVSALSLLVTGIQEGAFQPDEKTIAELKNQIDILSSRIASVSYYSYLLSPDVPVSKIRMNMLPLLDQVIEGKGIRCQIDDCTGTVDVWADWNLLARALEEVLKNAHEYSLSGIPHIRYSYDKGDTVIEVSNDGKLPDPRPQFFEPWARGDASRTSGGSGLGLPIVYQIMELHQGSVTIDEADGKVYVRLIFPPAAPAVK